MQLTKIVHQLYTELVKNIIIIYTRICNSKVQKNKTVAYNHSVITTKIIFMPIMLLGWKIIESIATSVVFFCGGFLQMRQVLPVEQTLVFKKLIKRLSQWSSG